ncbi:MAG: DUF1611 domain-containing protein [Gammaproteobacteria bacterium]|nr:MAG: DUF1611 domain-containing protein [Gammaproteobacteria bacterium]
MLKPTQNLKCINNNQPGFSPLPSDFNRAKCAYTTRNLDLSRAAGLLAGDHQPQHGDLVMAEVVRIGQHTRLELQCGRRARMHIGDRVLVCYGNRYAPDQFEASLPPDLGECHLVAAGGIAAQMQSRHRVMKRPTLLQPVGLITDADGRRINLRDYSLVRCEMPMQRPLTVAVAGSSMNAGKTTSASYLIKGLDRAGMKVSAAKITGTGSGGDFWFMVDSGAQPVLDFTCVGHATTFGLSERELEEVMETLVGELASHQPDVIVLEVADGIFQQETASLLASDCFRRLVDKILFTAGDATGALAGKLWLDQHQLPLIGISGALTESPLAAREAERASCLPVYTTDQLGDPELSIDLVFGDTVQRKRNLA